MHTVLSFSIVISPLLLHLTCSCQQWRYLDWMPNDRERVAEHAVHGAQASHVWHTLSSKFVKALPTSCSGDEFIFSPSDVNAVPSTFSMSNVTVRTSERLTSEQTQTIINTKLEIVLQKSGMVPVYCAYAPLHKPILVNSKLKMLKYSWSYIVQLFIVVA